MKFWNTIRAMILILGFATLGATIHRLQNKPAVICKVCHCGKEKCSRVCSEENMCGMRCEKECRKY